jgi:hypothetical protein
VLRTTVASNYSAALRTARDVADSLGAVRAAYRRRGPRSAGASGEARRLAG